MTDGCPRPPDPGCRARRPPGDRRTGRGPGGHPARPRGDALAGRLSTPTSPDPIEALRRLVLGGGKRLRPAFCHWGFVAGGGDPDDPAVVDAGAAFELLQAFALVHDDVMDGSARRRGAPTVHRAFEASHDEAGWRGEGRRFGEGVAILVGDLAHVYADQLLPDGPPEVAAIWDELRIELNIGQYLDVLGTARRRPRPGRRSPDRPLQVRQVHDRAAAAPRRRAGRSLRRPGSGAVRLRRPARRGVPAPRRHPRRLRRRGRTRQAGGRRPARGQAHAAAGDRRRALRLGGASAARPRRLARPRADDVARLQQLIVGTGALAEVEPTIDRSRRPGRRRPGRGPDPRRRPPRPSPTWPRSSPGAPPDARRRYEAAGPRRRLPRTRPRRRAGRGSGLGGGDAEGVGQGQRDHARLVGHGLEPGRAHHRGHDSGVSRPENCRARRA